MGYTESQLASLIARETSKGGTREHSIELLAKGIPWKPTTQAVAKTKRLFPEN